MLKFLALKEISFRLNLAGLAGFLSSSEAATAPAGQQPVLRSLDEELAKRGISLQLSGKVNNVYLSGANSSWAVNASAGGDGEVALESRHRGAFFWI